MADSIPHGVILNRRRELGEGGGGVEESETSEIWEHFNEISANPRFKRQSRTFPSFDEYPLVAALVNKVKAEIETWYVWYDHTLGNLNRERQPASKQLKLNFQLTIKPLDKGRKIVIQDSIQHEWMCPQVLSNQTWYQKISGKIISEFNTLHHGLILDTLHKGLDSPRTPTF